MSLHHPHTMHPTTPTPRQAAPTTARHAHPELFPAPVLAIHHNNTTEPTPNLVPPRTLASDIRAAFDHPVWGTPLAVVAIAPFGLMFAAVVAHIVGL